MMGRWWRGLGFINAANQLKKKLSKRAQKVLKWYYTEAQFVKCKECGKQHGVTLIKRATNLYICTECEPAIDKETRQFQRSIDTSLSTIKEQRRHRRQREKAMDLRVYGV